MNHGTVVVDKSFLQAAKAADVRALAASYRLLMTEALWYELLSNPVDRRACFSKFPQVDNPVDVVTHIGGFLRREIDRRRPAPRPSESIEKMRFKFNARLLEPDYKLPPEAEQVLDKQRQDLLSDVASIKERALHAPSFFPEVFVGSDASRNLARADAEHTITRKAGSLLEFYGGLRSPKGHRRFPPTRLINERWALYRWLQVQFLFSIDLYWRYGERLAHPLGPTTEEKIEHDVLDAQYMLIGALEGSFATREKKLQRWFTAICPEGTLMGTDDKLAEGTDGRQ